ncbi:MAG: hypothetical protein JW388_0252 [Nitrospira sp.]|nr:hypothetical protein [Nitrospira sp.]
MSARIAGRKWIGEHGLAVHIQPCRATTAQEQFVFSGRQFDERCGTEQMRIGAVASDAGVHIFLRLGEKPEGLFGVGFCGRKRLIGPDILFRQPFLTQLHEHFARRNILAFHHRRRWRKLVARLQHFLRQRDAPNRDVVHPANEAV